MQNQLDIFRNTKIIFGHHGAGLTNMIWAPDGTSVIEFPLDPHVSRLFGQLAEIIGTIDYWLFPHLSSPYLDRYKATRESASALVRLITQIIEKRGLQYLFKSHS